MKKSPFSMIPPLHRHTQLAIITVVMLILMALFEWLKQLFLPDLSIWGSHVITIFFTTALGATTFYFILTHFHREYDRRLREISRRRMSEAALRESEQKWHNAVNNAVVGFYQVTRAGDFILVNDQLAAILAYDSSFEVLDRVGNIRRLYVNPQDRPPLIDILSSRGVLNQAEVQFRTRMNTTIWVSLSARAFKDRASSIIIEGFVIDITKRKTIEAEKEQLYQELKASLEQVKTLSGMLPICSNCKKIRNDKGYWDQIENYIMTHSDAQFSHSICPECAKKLYPEWKPR